MSIDEANTGGQASHQTNDAGASDPPAPRVRAAIPKRIRFEVFKRDHFRCVYCGRTPSEVVLEVDHFEAHAAGGTDDPGNLVTACRDCNAGKSDRPITDALPQVHAEDVAELAERVEQMRAYREWRTEFERQLRLELDLVYEAWIDEFDGELVQEPDGGHYQCDVSFPSEKALLDYLDRLPVAELVDAVRIAGWRYRKRDDDPIARWAVKRYFYGVCRQKAQRRDEQRRRVRVTWDELAVLLPQLEELRVEIAGFSPSDPWRFCGDVLWKRGWNIDYGDGQRQPVAPPTEQIAALVGPKSENAHHPVLGSLAALDAATQTIRTAVPLCGQTCSCGRPKRPARREDFPRCEACGQAYEPVDERRSCVASFVEWGGRRWLPVPYGHEPWFNQVTIAQKWSRYRRLDPPQTPVIATRCEGCRTPFSGYHHPGCRNLACPVCWQRMGAGCSQGVHRAQTMDITPRQAAARLRQALKRRAGAQAAP